MIIANHLLVASVLRNNFLSNYLYLNTTYQWCTWSISQDAHSSPLCGRFCLFDVGTVLTHSAQYSQAQGLVAVTQFAVDKCPQDVQIVVQKDKIRIRSRLQVALAVSHAQGLGRPQGCRLQDLLGGAAGEVAEVLDARGHVHGTAGQGVCARDGGLDAHHGHVHVPQLVCPLGQAHGRHGVGDQHDALGVPLVGHTDRARVRVDAVSNDPVVRPVAHFAQQAHHTGITVVEGRHGVEHVCDHGGPCSNAGCGLVKVCGRVADGRNNAPLGQPLDGLQGTGQLGCERNDGHVGQVPIPLNQRLHALERAGNDTLVVCTFLLLVDERPLQVVAENSGTGLWSALVTLEAR
eukprot:comp11988_c0_seq1/m.6682 comp11988_c0_seq1/g.6682  ORF comp11988_c0_seq1/g.6682 comp11988_c0_seq1/m.6682 type:complete len:348 (+) comp11988_c0_seq1:226-1269(+)